MSVVWRQFIRSKLKRESIQIHQRLTWLVTSQSVFFAAFFILLAVDTKVQSSFDSNLVRGIAFLFPAIGIMVTTSTLISNLAAYLGIYRASGSIKKVKVSRNGFKFSILRKRFSSVLGFVVSTIIALTILISWLVILFLMTCAYQFPSDFINIF